MTQRRDDHPYNGEMGIFEGYGDYEDAMTQQSENRLDIWGDEEVRQRIEDIADAKAGLITLADAQAMAEARRMAADLTPDEAQRAVNAATRRSRNLVAQG